MINIYLLPAEESVLATRNDRCILRLEQPFTEYGNAVPKHIYITSNEVIKDNDWYLATLFGPTGSELVPIQFKIGHKPCGEIPCGDKIVITSDPILIESGVQAVTNDFLEWYVENPTLSITIKHVLVNPMGREVDPNNLTQNHSGCEWKYLSKWSNGVPCENIVMTEEPKLDFSCSCIRYEAGCFSAKCRNCGLLPKQKPLIVEKSFSTEEMTNIARYAFHFYKRNDLDDNELEEEFEKWLDKLKE